MDVEYRAAWVPFGDGHFDRQAAPAVDWVERECAEQNAIGLLVTPKAGVDGLTDSIRSFAARHCFTSARGGRPRRGGGGGPVLAYLPDLRDLEFAGGRARSSSLCAAEYPTFRLAGWAAARGAVNLATGETPAPFDDAVTKLLDFLVFEGHNGWFDDTGKRIARHVLGELRTAAPTFDPDFLAGYVLGMGRGAHAATNLHKMAGKIAA